MSDDPRPVPPERRAKALKLLEALAEDCDDDVKTGDHKWNRCRACTAAFLLTGRNEKELLRLLLAELTPSPVAASLTPQPDKAIAGALRSCIDAHGPVTKDQIGSATKRIVGALYSRDRLEIAGGNAVGNFVAGAAPFPNDPASKSATVSLKGAEDFLHEGCDRPVPSTVAASLTPQATPTWQPIATVPKDGSVFRAFGQSLIHPDFNPLGQVEACWDGDRILGAVWDGQFDCWNAVELTGATHWQPFPPSPLPGVAASLTEPDTRADRRWGIVCRNCGFATSAHLYASQDGPRLCPTGIYQPSRVSESAPTPEEP